VASPSCGKKRRKNASMVGDLSLASGG